MLAKRYPWILERKKIKLIIIFPAILSFFLSPRPTRSRISSFIIFFGKFLAIWYINCRRLLSFSLYIYIHTRGRRYVSCTVAWPDSGPFWRACNANKCAKSDHTASQHINLPADFPFLPPSFLFRLGWLHSIFFFVLTKMAPFLPTRRLLSFSPLTKARKLAAGRN